MPKAHMYAPNQGHGQRARCGARIPSDFNANGHNLETCERCMASLRAERRNTGAASNDGQPSLEAPKSK